MRIGIIGTRGIPNQYGGFEQFAEYVSVGLVQRGHEVYVYNSHNHNYKESTWNGVNLVHCYDPEYKIGTAGQFIYDLNCILDSRKRNFDVLLQLGYTSSSVWSRFMPSKSLVLTNMDGLEWKRSKYSAKVQKFLRWAEKLAVKHSHSLVADSVGIQHYLKEKYSVDSTFIPYGAYVFNNPLEEKIVPYGIKAFGYDMLIARMEPENNIEVILDGVKKANTGVPFIVIGNTTNAFGQYLVNKFRDTESIIFLGGIYDLEALNNLRYYSRYYFHGHSVGGTNPSLLEAMASSTFIVANQNEFNSAILGEDAAYFSDSNEVAIILADTDFWQQRNTLVRAANVDKITQTYTWENIIDAYERYFIKEVEEAKKTLK